MEILCENCGLGIYCGGGYGIFSVALEAVRVMKKIIILIISVLCFLSALPAYAEFEQPPVSDAARYLTEEQKAELTERLDKIRKKYKFDVAFVSEKELSSFDVQNAADDIYDYNGYGYRRKL